MKRETKAKYGVTWGFVCTECSKFKAGRFIPAKDYRGEPCQNYVTVEHCTHCKKDTESHDMAQLIQDAELHDEYWSSVL